MFQNFQFKVFFEVSFDMNGGKEEAAKLVKSHLLKRNCRVGKHNILSLISHLQEPLCHSLLGKVRKHKRKAIQLLECLKSMLFYKLVCTKCKVPRRAIVIIVEVASPCKYLKKVCDKGLRLYLPG